MANLEYYRTKEITNEMLEKLADDLFEGRKVLEIETKKMNPKFMDFMQSKETFTKQDISRKFSISDKLSTVYLCQHEANGQIEKIGEISTGKKGRGIIIFKVVK